MSNNSEFYGTCRGCGVSLNTLDTDVDDGESLCFLADSGTIIAVTSPSLLVHTASPHTLIKHWHCKIRQCFRQGPEVIKCYKMFSCSTQLSIKFSTQQSMKFDVHIDIKRART